MTAGIYKIARVGSDECYVGQAVDIEQRWQLHRSMLRKNRHHSKRLQRVWNKHGPKVFLFVVLQTGFDPSDKATLTAAEQRWIDDLKPCYNTCKAGWSRAGLKHSAETRAKISKAITGRKLSPEQRADISRRQKGRVPPPLSSEHKSKLTFAGRRHTEESIKKFSASKRGKPLSEAHKAAISATKRRNLAQAGVGQ